MATVAEPPLERRALAYSESLTLGDLLLRAAARWPERDAVIFPGERLDFGALADRAETIARGLIGVGVRPREHVGVLMANGPDCVATLFGVALAGAVIVPINTRYRAVELPFVLNDAQLAAVVTSDRIDDYVDLPALLAAALRHEASPRLRAVVCLGAREAPGTVSEAELMRLAAEVPIARVDERRAGVKVRDMGILLYTSGTTALPRGCVLTHESVVRCWREVGRILGVVTGDRCWAPCPLFHMGAIGPLLFCVSTGAAFISDTWFRADEAVRLCERERASVLYPAYPPITQAFLTSPLYREADLEAARVILNVAPPDTLLRMQEAIPQAIQLQLYGLTEAGGVVTYTRRDASLDVRTRTCGPPLPGWEVRIVDPGTGDDVPTGVDGEIVIRGVTQFERYWNDPEKTAAVVEPEGWLHTGDHGALDERGNLRFLGRLKDMLKVGGENVAPAEIESHLSAHPAVKLVQVVGIPDERLVEVPAAWVELRPGAKASAEELIAYCQGALASFKIPRHVRFTADWPLSATKIQKGPLRERMIAELER
jgi:fatty-acyl-CoA synthase